ncbi:MAG: twin-arginine translocase subunit TatC [Candidatus Krumholzibacteria bacterium]|nr:twin-arginine translocase subunit TatC [Candidatus Krumholzibacteria bacterium]
MAIAKDPAKNASLLREMSFLQHLEELRGVLIRSAVALVAATVVCWFFSARLVDLLVGDLPVDHLNFFAPAEAFMVRLKVSLVTGAMAAFPYVIYQVWSFVSPGLFAGERKRVYPVVVTATVLFYVGVAFCYLVLIPLVLDFLLGFGTDKVMPLLSVSAYFAMVARLCFTFGLVFQLPIVVFVLSLTGLVTPSLLLRQWRWAVLIVFVVAAILTPPDPASQVLMAVPVLLLYIGSVFVAHVALKRRRDGAATPENGRDG